MMFAGRRPSGGIFQWGGSRYFFLPPLPPLPPLLPFPPACERSEPATDFIAALDFPLRSILLALVASLGDVAMVRTSFRCGNDAARSVCDS